MTISIISSAYRLRDLVERLDRSLDVVESADFDDGDAAVIERRDYFHIEQALEAAAAFLHELHLRVTAP